MAEVLEAISNNIFTLNSSLSFPLHLRRKIHIDSFCLKS